MARDDADDEIFPFDPVEIVELVVNDEEGQVEVNAMEDTVAFDGAIEEALERTSPSLLLLLLLLLFLPLVVTVVLASDADAALVERQGAFGLKVAAPVATFVGGGEEEEEEEEHDDDERELLAVVVIVEALLVVDEVVELQVDDDEEKEEEEEEERTAVVVVEVVEEEEEAEVDDALALPAEAVAGFVVYAVAATVVVTSVGEGELLFTAGDDVTLLLEPLPLSRVLFN